MAAPLAETTKKRLRATCYPRGAFKILSVRNVSLNGQYTFAELEHALVKVEKRKKQPDASHGQALAEGYKPRNQGG